MSSLSIKKISVEEQHEEFVKEIKYLKTEVDGLTHLSDELINENMTLININERVLTENEELLAENEQLKKIISTLTFQTVGVTSVFLNSPKISEYWEQVDP